MEARTLMRLIKNRSNGFRFYRKASVRQASYSKPPSFNEAAQAMVEFVIILTIIMTIIAGMLYFFRLHLYQFWAQQEVRYLTFEETWVPRAYYNAEGEQPVTLLEGNGEAFVRPGVVSGLGVTRNESSFGSMTDLISPLFSKNNLINDTPTGSFVQTAFASIRSHFGESNLPEETNPDLYPSVVPELDEALERRLHNGGFGITFCDGAKYQLRKNGFRPESTQFASLRCAANQERGLARTLANQTDFPGLFREMADRVNNGSGVGEAIESTVKTAVAEGFYTYFSNEVENRFNDAPQSILLGRADAAIDAVDSSMTRMIGDLRYIGSSAAILALLGEGIVVAGENYNNRDPQHERNIQKDLEDILHIDAANILPVIGDGYLLNPTYLPVPPKFGPMAGGFFTGPMRSVLSLDTGDVNSMIENSVKRVSLTYDSANGLFSGASKRFRLGVKLSSNMVIDTDPWHIQRRIGGTGDYRSKGEEFDQVGEETEEGRLRRRVSGLWLFPSPPDAFFDPILAFIGLDELTDLVDAFRPVGSFISQIKSLLTNNPLTQLMNTLSKIPVIGSLFPKFPVWPAVRPDAYPTSVEMGGDKKAGSERNFEDYVKEQKDFNPDPDPTFN